MIPQQPDGPVVRAAGGVVWRDVGQMEVLVVHRPKYDDWSLPKGKLNEDESFAAAALREITEETGVHGTLGAELGEVRYADHKDRPKVVRWWAVQVDKSHQIGEPDDPDEVDDVRWLSFPAADELLSYDSDREVLGRFAATVSE